SSVGWPASPGSRRVMESSMMVVEAVTIMAGLGGANAAEWIRLLGGRARLLVEQRAGLGGGGALRIVLGHAVPGLPRAALVAQVAIAEADLEQRVGHLRRVGRDVQHLLELGHGLAVVALHVVRL